MRTNVLATEYHMPGNNCTLQTSASQAYALLATSRWRLTGQTGNDFGGVVPLAVEGAMLAIPKLKRKASQVRFSALGKRGKRRLNCGIDRALAFQAFWRPDTIPAVDAPEWRVTLSARSLSSTGPGVCDAYLRQGAKFRLPMQFPFEDEWFTQVTSTCTPCNSWP